MPGLISEGFLLLPILFLSLISSVLNFVFIVIFLCEREKEEIQRYIIFLNLSLLTSALGFFSCVSGRAIIETSQVQGVNRVAHILTTLLLYAGLSSASVHWLHLAACFSERTSWLHGWRKIITYIPTSITIAAILMPDLSESTTSLGFSLADYGAVNGITFVSAIIFECLASILYFKTFLEKKDRRAFLMAIASVIPILGGANVIFSMLFQLSLDPALSIIFLLILIIAGNALLAFAHFQKKPVNMLLKAMREIFYDIKDALIIIDQELKLIYSNSLAREILPHIETEKGMVDQVYQIGPILEKIRGDPLETFEVEINLTGLIYTTSVFPLIKDHHPLGWIIRLTDITKLKHLEEQLLHQTLHDPLTKLPNRTLLLDRLNHAIFNAQRDASYKYAILSIDLDRFKRINEELGRQLGDQILIEVAKRLETCIRKIDTVARMEGDEFVILLEKISGVRAATEVSSRVIELLSQPIKLNDQELHTSASIGIAVGSQQHKNPDDILREGDIALHEAKERGRCQYVIHDKEMHGHVAALLDLETRLQRAIQENELVLHYQPIFSLPDQRIFGLEALIRWAHPEHGVMLPAEFLPEAMSSNLILTIGRWAIQQACQDISNWNSRFPMHPPLQIYLNLSLKELIAPDLSDHIASTLEENRLNPSCLALEIKEEMIIENDLEITEILMRLKSIGVQIVVDQFGTGNSSLRILSAYPIDTIKIDRSFIRNIPRSIKDYEIVRNMIELGHNLKMGVIAEGVEAPHEFVELKSMQCKLVQGDYFSKPLAQHAVTLLLEKMIKREAEIPRMDHRKLFGSVK